MGFKREVKEKADDLLRYGISVSQGYGFNSPANVRMLLLLDLLKSLKKDGFLWHSQILDYWIHRFMRDNKKELQAYRLKACKPDYLRREREPSKSVKGRGYKHG